MSGVISRRAIGLGAGLGLALLAAAGTRTTAQEDRPVPDDSVRLTMPGCAKDPLFVVDRPQGREAKPTDVPAGRRFRLSGPREVLDDIRSRQGRMVEITGLVRKMDLGDGGGIRMFGGRVRIGGTTARRDPVRDPMYNQVVIDVEGYQLLPDACPMR